MSWFLRWLLPLAPLVLTAAAAAAVAVAVRAFTYHPEFCLVSRARGCWQQPLTMSAKATGISASSLAVALLVTAAVLSLRMFRRTQLAA